VTISRRVVAVLLAAGPLVLPVAAGAENVPAERLQALADVMPAAPAGFTRQPRLGTYSSASASTATATYEAEDGRAFGVVVTFSAENAKQNRAVMKDKAQRDMFGVEPMKLKGRDGLARKAGNKNDSVAVYVVVLSDSRVLSVTDAFGTTDPAILKAVLESADLDLIAKRP
jgi:hypothetical protein